MPDDLPLQTKIAATQPIGSFSEQVETFNSASYRVRANVGINPSQEEWSITWVGLTRTEAGQLKAAFQGAGGVSTFDYQSPLDSASHKYTVAEHSANPMDENSIWWTYTATLIREYGF